MPLQRRVVVGIRAGLSVAGLLSLWVFVVWAVQGGGTFAFLGTTLPTVIGIYFIGGAITGGLVGALLPMTQRVLGAGIVGVIAGIPTAALIVGSLEGFAPWTEIHTVSAVGTAVLVGGLSGVLIRLGSGSPGGKRR